MRKQVNKLILLHLISPRPPIHHSQTWISLMDNKVLESHAGACVRIRFSNYSRLFSCNLTETDRSRRSGSETLVFVNSRSCLASIVSGFRLHDLCRETSGVTQRCHQWPANQTTWFCTVQESVATLPSWIQWIIPKNSLDLLYVAYLALCLQPPALLDSYNWKQTWENVPVPFVTSQRASLFFFWKVKQAEEVKDTVFPDRM